MQIKALCCWQGCWWTGKPTQANPRSNLPVVGCTKASAGLLSAGICRSRGEIFWDRYEKHLCHKFSLSPFSITDKIADSWTQASNIQDTSTEIPRNPNYVYTKNIGHLQRSRLDWALENRFQLISCSCSQMQRVKDRHLTLKTNAGCVGLESSKQLGACVKPCVRGAVWSQYRGRRVPCKLCKLNFHCLVTSKQQWYLKAEET